MTGRDLTGHFFDGYHGTESADDAAAIASSGFDLSKTGSDGADSGPGIYMTSDRGWAAEHAFGFGFNQDSDEYDFERAQKGRIIPVRLKTERPYSEAGNGALEHHPVHVQELAKRIAVKNGTKPEHAYIHVSDALRELGHDSWIHPGGSLAVAFNPENVEVTGEPLDYKAHHGRTPEEDYWEAKEPPQWG